MEAHVNPWAFVGVFALFTGDAMKLAYIDQVTTENTGGGCMVDFVILQDGRVLGISDECVCLYKSMEDFWEATPDEKPSIDLRT